MAEPALTFEPATNGMTLRAAAGAQVAACLFYSATLLSSVGSMIFSVCVVAFMIKAGYPLLDVGLLVAGMRLTPLLVNLFWGHVADSRAPRRLIIHAECGAFVISALILLTWRAGPDAFWLFAGLTLLRCAVTAVQAGARSKTAKIFSLSVNDSSQRHAIWLNKAVHGSTVFAGLLGYVVVKYLSLSWAIAIDGATFAAAGLMLSWVRAADCAGMDGAGTKTPVLQKFRTLYRLAPAVACLDLVLAVVMGGTMTLMARAVGTTALHLIPLLVCGYGIAVWVAGFLERTAHVQRLHAAVWVLLGGTYVVGCLWPGRGAVTWCVFFAKDTAYWILYHRYSARLQRVATTEVIGSLTAARMTQMIAVLAAFEIAVSCGAPLSWEGWWRCAVCAGVAAALKWRPARPQGVAAAWLQRGVITLGCIAAGSLAASPSRLRIAVPVSALALDPHRLDDAYGMTAALQLHRGLLRYGPSGNIELDLASSWRESDNHCRYTFTLKNASFADGQKITAEHVRQSFARIFFLGGSFAADIDYLAGSQLFRASHKLSDLGVVATGPDAVTFTLARPSAVFLKQLAAVDAAVLPTLSYQKNMDFGPRFAGSGPFRIKEVTASSLLLAKWRPDHLDSARPPDEIEFLLGKSAPIALATDGSIDVLDQTPVQASSRQKLMHQGWQTSVTELVSERFVIMNPHVLSADARQYMRARVDQDDIAKIFNLPSLRPAYGLIPDGIPGSLARESLRVARGRAAPTGKIDLEYSGTNDVSAKLALYLKRVWETATFTVRLRPLDVDTHLGRMFNGQGSVIIGAKGLDYFDGFSVLAYFRAGYPGNFFHVDDPVIDQMLDRAMQISDGPARARAYKDLQEKILSHTTVIPLLFGSTASGLWGPRVASVPPHPGGLHLLPFETIAMRE